MSGACGEILPQQTDRHRSIGPAILLPNSIGILGATYAPGPRQVRRVTSLQTWPHQLIPHQNFAFAIFGAMAPGGAVIGAVFASLFALVSWPWAFYSFAIALACMSIATCFFVPSPPLPAEPVEDKSVLHLLARLDIFAGLLGVTSLILINFAWNQAPIVGWREAYVYVTLILGFLFGAAFFWVEIKMSKYPLIPFDALTADVGFVLAIVGLGWSCFGPMYLYLCASPYPDPTAPRTGTPTNADQGNSSNSNAAPPPS